MNVVAEMELLEWKKKIEERLEKLEKYSGVSQFDIDEEKRGKAIETIEQDIAEAPRKEAAQEKLGDLLTHPGHSTHVEGTLTKAQQEAD